MTQEIIQYVQDRLERMLIFGQKIEFVDCKIEKDTIDIDVVANLKGQEQRRDLGDKLKEIAFACHIKYDTQINFHQYSSKEELPYVLK